MGRMTSHISGENKVVMFQNTNPTFSIGIYYQSISSKDSPWDSILDGQHVV
jgi:hypothetical protein